MRLDSYNASLIDALGYAAVRELPEEWNGEEIWLFAIGLTSRMNGKNAFVALERTNDGGIRIVKDFSPELSSIYKIEKIYPYMYLDSGQIPVFKDEKSKDEKIAWLSHYDKATDYSSMSLKELKKAVINMAAQLVLKNLKKGE